MITMALVLILSRIHIHHISRSYETVRWILVAALLLFATHFLVQMIGHFRENDDDVGALINILFFAPATYLFHYSSVRMSSTGKNMLRYVVAIGVSISLILICFGVGWQIYGSLHMKYAVHAMAAVFLASMIYFTIAPFKETRRMRQLIENETASDLSDYNTYMRAGVTILFGLSLFIPFAVFNTRAIVLFGPFILIALLFYVVSFVALGYNISPLSTIIDATESKEEATIAHIAYATEDSAPQHSPAKAANIEQAISAWHATGGYCDPELTCATMALRLGVKRAELVQYISECHGLTFRVWLSNIRIEEAKRLLMEQPNFSNEAIAQECGFSSRTWLQQKFKASTGMTPAEWRAAQQKQPADSTGQ